MNFTFNMDMGGFQVDETPKIIQICQNYHSCDECPVLKHGQLIMESNIGQLKLSCSTAIIRNLKNGRS